MDYNKAALEMHETHHGKVGITSKVEVRTRDDLSTAYTPGVAEPCRKIKENPDDVYKYTFKGNMVAVVSNGTAVLGLGDIGPEAGLPVMEGKAVLFKEFGGVDAFPICIDAHDAASVIAACKAIAPTFGGINLEDIKSPECFEIEETLERELDIPVFHDDQHGTAIVVTAALINALRVVGKKMEDVHIVLNGPGAAGTAIIKMLMTAGAKDIVAVDQFGTLYKGCNSAEAHKNWLGEVTNPRQIKGGLKEAIAGADVFIGVSKPGILTTELCQTINKDAPHPAAARLWEEYLYTADAQNLWFKGGANPVLLDSMKEDGTVDQATLKDAITIEGEPVSYTNDDSTRITEWLQNNWDKTIGN